MASRPCIRRCIGGVQSASPTSEASETGQFLNLPIGPCSAVLTFLRDKELLDVRLSAKVAVAAVSQLTFDPWTVPTIRGQLTAWRRIFPHAKSAALVNRSDVTNASLANLSGLSTLVLDRCANVTYEGLAHFPGLVTLRIDRCNGIAERRDGTDECVLDLPALRHLNVNTRSGLDEAVLSQMVGAASLKTLSLEGFKSLSLRNSFSQAASSLQELDITQCTDLSSLSLRQFKNLKSLRIVDCPSITDAAFLPLSTHVASGKVQHVDSPAASITHLHLSGCGTGFTPATFTFLTSLTDLSLHYCSGIKPRGLLVLKDTLAHADMSFDIEHDVADDITDAVDTMAALLSAGVLQTLRFRTYSYNRRFFKRLEHSLRPSMKRIDDEDGDDNGKIAEFEVLCPQGTQ